MLEKPELPDEKIVACLHDEYKLRVGQVEFLPLGADMNTFVYRAVAEDQTPYFVKLRRGLFDETAVALPKWLSDQGVAQIIPPLVSKTGQLWANLEGFTLILYPFVEGHNAYEVTFSDELWHVFGTALKRLHTADVPPTLTSRIQQEAYSPQGRESVKNFLARIEQDTFDEPIALQLAAFLKTKRAQVHDLVERTERLAWALQARTPELVVCHSDLHAGNMLIDTNHKLYIVDWDNPILAPKERDLMFIGGGQGFIGHTAHAEERLFYAAYGQIQIDPIALAYYRYERIVQDIAVECQQIFSTTAGDEDRNQELRYLISNFQPNGALEVAYQSETV